MLEVAIVGAGPYGLAIAAHLRARGVPFRIFGQPMQFWREMPERMFLKSFAFATSISNPAGLRYDAWCRERGLEAREPCSIDSFTEYGRWVQQQLVPEAEPVEVDAVEQVRGGYRVTLSTGEQVEAARVVVAVGLRSFHRLPEALAPLPPELVFHTARNRSYEAFRGLDVCVLGAGQSALEAAALLHESGARPQLLVRGPRVIFHTRTPLERPLLQRLRWPLSVVGESRLGFCLQHFPGAAHFAPDWLRVPLTKRFLGPAGTWWLRDRVEGKVPLQLRCEVRAARVDQGKLVLRVRQDGSERELRVDRVVCGTGYQVDLDRLPLLSSDLRAKLARIERAPRLDRHFQSSVRGLYFVGALSTFSFGPLFRFVAGTAHTAPVVARHLARTVAQPARDAQLALQ